MDMHTNQDIILSYDEEDNIQPSVPNPNSGLGLECSLIYSSKSEFLAAMKVRNQAKTINQSKEAPNLKGPPYLRIPRLTTSQLTSLYNEDSDSSSEENYPIKVESPAAGAPGPPVGPVCPLVQAVNLVAPVLGMVDPEPWSHMKILLQNFFNDTYCYWKEIIMKFNISIIIIIDL